MIYDEIGRHDLRVVCKERPCPETGTFVVESEEDAAKLGVELFQHAWRCRFHDTGCHYHSRSTVEHFATEQ